MTYKPTFYQNSWSPRFEDLTEENLNSCLRASVMQWTAYDDTFGFSLSHTTDLV